MGLIDCHVIFVGGLGANQFRIEPSPALNLPPGVFAEFLGDVGYVPFGKIPDIIGAIKKTQQYMHVEKVVVVCHSMGWIAGAKACVEGLVDKLIACDPVGIPGVASDRWPHPYGTRQKGLFIKALPSLGITQLNVLDGPPITSIAEHHNELIHAKEFIDLVQREILNA